MSILRVSFEIVERWDREEYKEFIRTLKINEDVELFLLTTETDQGIIDAVQGFLDLDSSHIIQYIDNTAKKAGIIANQIKIHFDEDYDFTQDLTNTTNPKIWGIYISKMYNFYDLKMKYVSQFEFILKYFT